MDKTEIKVCVVRVGGTNCDAETRRSFEELGVKTSVVHLNALAKKQRLEDYDILVFPGGFSFGDYVRAGAILAKGFSAKLGKPLRRFVDEGKPILGICNGFQILVEAGLLPGFDGGSEVPEAALATNFPSGFRCCWVRLRHENLGRCVFTSRILKSKVVRIPIAHGEGRFVFPKEEENEQLEQLLENDQLVFRYCHEDGQPAEGEYPDNPNGSFYDVAGICNPEGNVFGLMPHPERTYYGWQLPDWTRMDTQPLYGDGRLIFESVIDYVSRKF